MSYNEMIRHHGPMNPVARRDRRAEVEIKVDAECAAHGGALTLLRALRGNWSSQAARAIRTATLGVLCSTSTGGLSTGWSPPALQCSQGAGTIHLGACFPLRCIQRLSQPAIATRRCTWRCNRDTSGPSDSVLSY